MPELLLSQRFEVPVDSGSGRDLLSPFTGDAAQQESFSCHGFSQGVHLCTAAVALRHCRKKEGGRREEEGVENLKVKQKAGGTEVGVE